MQKEHNGLRERDAMLEGGIGGAFFDAFSSKKAESRILWNDDIQRCSEDFQCCSFTGKEKDEETGYGYFGARYMDHELMTMWLSVDPMADKYPSISPYAYCAWNPIKLVDPDGREIRIGCGIYVPNKKGNEGIAKALDMIYESKAGAFVINYLIKSKNIYSISAFANPLSNENPGYVDADNQVYLNIKKYGLNPLILSHELFHAFQDENGVRGKLRSKEVEAFIFSGIVLSQLNKGRDVSSLMEVMPSGMYKAYTPLSSISKKGKEYALAMNSLTKEFSTEQMGIAVSCFLNFSREGEGYRNERGYKYCGGNGVGYSPSTSLLKKYSNYIY